MGKKAQIFIEAQDLTRTALQSVERNLKGVNAAADAIARSFSAVLGATGAVMFGRALVGEAMKAEQASNRLTAVLRATGHSAGIAKAELDSMADSLARSTQFDDESIRGAEAALLKFGNVSGDVFREGLKLSADFAAFMGTDIADAAQTVGKALTSPAEALGALERQIGKFTPQQEEMIKRFVEQGRLAEAQSAVLEVLRGKIGGTAEIMNTGLTGAAKGAAKAWDELLETMGRTDAIGGTVERALQGLASLLRDIDGLLQGRDTPLAQLLRDFFETVALSSRGSPLLWPAWALALGAKSMLPEPGAGGVPSAPPSWDEQFAAQQAQIRAWMEGRKGPSMDPQRFEELVRGMKRELAAAGALDVLGRTSELEKTMRAIETGVYGPMDAGQKKILRNLATEIDTRKQLTEAIKDGWAALQKELEEQEDAYERETRAANDLLRKRQGEAEAIRRQIDPTRALVEERERINELAGEGLLNADEAAIALRKVEQRMLEAGGALEKLERDGDVVKDIARDLGMTFSSAFEDAILHGKQFSEVLRGIAQDILRIGARKLITEPLAGNLTSVLGKIDFGSILGGPAVSSYDAYTGWFPGRASGGPVAAGEAYLVGERGPELFVPSASGSIMPNGAGAGGAVTVNVYSSPNIDSRTDRAEVAALVRAEARAVEGRILDSLRRGGVFAQAVGRA